MLAGSRLLERYGMTETGMLLGNPYAGERRPETVGQPFRGVRVRLANADGSDAGAGACLGTSLGACSDRRRAGRARLGMALRFVGQGHVQAGLSSNHCCILPGLACCCSVQQATRLSSLPGSAWLPQVPASCGCKARSCSRSTGSGPRRRPRPLTRRATSSRVGNRGGGGGVLVLDQVFQGLID